MEPNVVIKPGFPLNQVLSDLVLYSQERFTGATGDDPTLSIYIFFEEKKTLKIVLSKSYVEVENFENFCYLKVM
jgi:hypothetical protein